MISVVSYYTTKFGELWDKSLFDLVEEAAVGALKNTGIGIGEIDAIFFANMLAGRLENNLHTSAKIAELFKVNIPVYRVEAACASGGVAFNLAKNYLEANPNKTVLVLGAEKMTDYSPEETTESLAGAASGEEQEAGLTFPGLYAMMANFYLKKYRYTEENLAYVSVKNHFHGSLNDKAHFRNIITIEQVLKSSYIAVPLKVLDSSPISDGASALIITNNKNFIKRIKSPVRIFSSKVVNDAISLKSRKRLDEILATKIAADQAFTEAQVERKDISVAEVHDCFSIAEILAMEDLGFWRKGKGGEEITKKMTMLNSGSMLTVNTSGGLKAAGHPVGATGIKQIGEIYLQLSKQAIGRQVKNAKYGLAQNVGGSGGTAVVTILGV